MKQAMRLLSVLVVISLLTVGVLVAVSADAATVTEVLNTTFDDLATGILYQVDDSGNDVVGNNGVLPGFELYNKKLGEKYEIVEGTDGNKYLKLTKGAQDPVLTPIKSNVSNVLGKGTDDNAFSVSMDLSIDAEATVAPYSFRLRTEVGSWQAANRHEFPLFEVTATGALRAFGTETGITLTAGEFTKVTVTVDFGVDQRYADATVSINGALIAARQLDVRETKWYTGYDSTPGKSEAEGTWTNLRNQVATCRWITGSQQNGDPASVLLFDNVIQYTGVVQPTYGICTLETNGGKLEGESVFEFNLNETTPLPEPTRDGAVFVGWFTDPEFSGEAVTELTGELGAQVMLYAKWTLLEGSIFFETNGGTGDFDGVPTKFKVGEGVTVTLPELTRDAGGFIGWYLTEDFSGEMLGDTYVIGRDVDHDVTFYAKFLGAYPTIGFDGVSGIGPGKTVTLDDGRKLELSRQGSGGEIFEIRTEGDNSYLYWESGVKNPYIYLRGLSASQYLLNGNHALAFSVDLKRDNASDPVMPFSISLRDFKVGRWYNVIAMGGVDKDGNVYAGGANASSGVKIATLNADAYQTFTFVFDFDTMTLDAMVDGVEVVKDRPFTLPAPDPVNGVPDVTPLEWMNAFDGIHFAGSTYSAGGAKVRMDNFKLEEVDMNVRDGFLVSLIDGADVTYIRGKGSVTLTGLWTSVDGTLSTGTVAITGETSFYKVSVGLLPGASIRTAAPSGLRFESVINKTVYDALVGAGYTVEFGTYIFPADKYAGAVPEDAVFSTFTSADYLVETEGAYTYYTSLIDLLPQNQVRPFGAVSYLRATKDGEDPYYYETEYAEADNARSVYQVARAIAEAGELADMTEDQQAAVTGYMDAVLEINVNDPDDFYGAEIVTIENYESPYLYAYVVEDGIQVFGDARGLCAVILDGHLYTAGWGETSVSGVLVPIPGN